MLISGNIAHVWDEFRRRRVPHTNISEKKTNESMDSIDTVVNAEGAELWINHAWHQMGTGQENPQCSRVNLVKRLRSLVTGMKFCSQLV